MVRHSNENMLPVLLLTCLLFTSTIIENVSAKRMTDDLCGTTTLDHLAKGKSAATEVTFVKAFKEMRGDMVWPTPGADADTRIMSAFGPRLKKLSQGQRYDWHRGVDISGETGDTIDVIYPGTVVRLSNTNTGGLGIMIEHDFFVGQSSPPAVTFHDTLIVTKWYSYYGHLDEILVNEGDEVNAGERIGSLGMTGAISSHLHFEVRVGTRCSLEYALGHPESTCNEYGIDPHVNPYFVLPFSEIGCSAVGADLVETPGWYQDGSVRVSAPRRVPDVNKYSVQLVVPTGSDQYEVIESHVLDLNLRTGYNADTTEALDTQDKSKPYLDPISFGSTSSDTWDLYFVIPYEWIESKGAESKFIVTVTNTWEDTPAQLEFGLGDAWA
jgi:hypothetical protein